MGKPKGILNEGLEFRKGIGLQAKTGRKSPFSDESASRLTESPRFLPSLEVVLNYIFQRLFSTMPGLILPGIHLFIFSFRPEFFTFYLKLNKIYILPPPPPLFVQHSPDLIFIMGSAEC